jgi:hypothetical protein
MGSGGGSSGGGSSGEVDYPTYMKEIHEDLLNHSAFGTTDIIDQSLTSVINTALGNSPFTGEAAYDPEVAMDEADTAICAFDTVVDAMDHTSDWQSAVINVASVIDDNIIDSDYIKDDVDAYAEIVDDEIEAKVLPQFEAGMRDANAVMTSAFVIGKALIWDGRNRDVNKYQTELRFKLHTQRNEIIIRSVDRMLSNLVHRVEFEKAVAALTTDAKRVRIVAMKEEVDQQLSIEESDARWDLELYEYAGNLLASIGGASTSTKKSQPSQVQSALGGALSGAAMGAQVGGGYGAAIGGVIGLGASLL